jgi:hypothetical protein
MAEQRQRQLIGRDAAAVVNHFDSRRAAALDEYLNSRRPRIKRILKQLFGGRSGSFHNLAGGNFSYSQRVE